MDFQINAQIWAIDKADVADDVITAVNKLPRFHDDGGLLKDLVTPVADITIDVTKIAYPVDIALIAADKTIVATYKSNGAPAIGPVIAAALPPFQYVLIVNAGNLLSVADNNPTIFA